MRYLERYYAFLIKSKDEIVLVARGSDGDPLAAAVVSMLPRTYSRRVLRTTLFPFVLGAFTSLLFGPKWRRQGLFRVVRGSFADEVFSHSSPELIYLYVSGNSRSQGLGRQLVNEVKEVLRSKGCDSMFVSTFDIPGNKALTFYQRNGFVRVDSGKRFGCRFAVLEAKLAASGPAALRAG